MGFTKAIREEVPLLISLSGTSGSGKTFSGLLLAAGLAGPNGRVGMIDAENKRGSLYADDPLIMKALPQGYERSDIFAPFTPKSYIAQLVDAERAGITVCLIDSTSHEWEGEGGCCDIAEDHKLRGMPNWALAKREHKRFSLYCQSSKMHIIFCLRARDKVKILKDANGKEQIVPQGIQPIAEKNFVFEMLLSLGFDEATHHAYGIKVPGMLAPFFPGNQLLTEEHGEKIWQWNQTGAKADGFELVKKRAQAAAQSGVASYQAFFGSLTAVQKRSLVDTIHGELKLAAEQSDALAKEQESEPEA